ncbi:hypothetical protein CTAYLR_001032 [Chrysophaeum taylorii]|uniref:Proteasome endopeptidase complex n=1 Tax=Chrysophaeum taylorii TaxID=2483200 RepID=A0AAD7UGC7_9STRA|nr:hypothetical protein CTAYLR_001032 [Chrysophaeum taylorii]
MRAASLGGSILGVCAEDKVIIATGHPAESSPSLRAYPVERTWRFDDDLSVSVVGLMADAHIVADYAYDRLDDHRLAFGTSPPPRRLADAIADAMTAAARQSRPLGVHVVVAGRGGLWHVDPGGRLRQFQALAVGNQADALVRDLAKHLEAAGPLDEATAAALLRRAWRDALVDSDAPSDTSPPPLDVTTL